jgi:23S rRNA (uracil1939-C5)-methyltransferase
LAPKSTPILSSIELTIDSLSYNGGRGVGRFEGVVVFVPQTAPGDVVRVQVTSKRARFWEGEVIEILQPGSSRRKPPCPVADRCGGCSWQHVQYPMQIAQKQKILNDSLRALKKVGEWETLPFLAAADEFHYRNRVQIQIRDGKKGFFAKRSQDLVEVKECWIADSEINRQLKDLKPEPGVQRLELRLSEGDFSQVNGAQNAVLKERVLALSSIHPEWIMDLYSGSGNITRPLSEKFKSIPLLAIELSPKAVELGRRQLGAANWHCGDVGKILAKMEPLKGSGLVVLDPPRTGCTSDVIQQIQRHRPKQIVYVSCNPTTFARDCLPLVQSGSYKLETVQGLDMFPQTEHVELIASLCSAT